MLDADRKTALFVQKAAENLYNTSDFVADVVAESETEPDVGLEKILNRLIRLQLPQDQYAKTRPVTVLASDEDMDEYCKAREQGPRY
jgi:hypothetical protein